MAQPVFQSTHPVRGATACITVAGMSAWISIHAPREGCDEGDGVHAGRQWISIHAPREGCDPAPGAGFMAQPVFQSTHPVRGATASRPDRSALWRDFNPRTP